MNRTIRKTIYDLIQISDTMPTNRVIWTATLDSDSLCTLEEEPHLTALYYIVRPIIVSYPLELNLAVMVKVIMEYIKDPTVPVYTLREVASTVVIAYNDVDTRSELLEELEDELYGNVDVDEEDDSDTTESRKVSETGVLRAIHTQLSQYMPLYDIMYEAYQKLILIDRSCTPFIYIELYSLIPYDKFIERVIETGLLEPQDYCGVPHSFTPMSAVLDMKFCINRIVKPKGKPS